MEEYLYYKQNETQYLCIVQYMQQKNSNVIIDRFLIKEKIIKKQS